MVRWRWLRRPRSADYFGESNDPDGYIIEVGQSNPGFTYGKRSTGWTPDLARANASLPHRQTRLPLGHRANPPLRCSRKKRMMVLNRSFAGVL
jgi:hypothetical protein